jgi:hypothetical protein
MLRAAVFAAGSVAFFAWLNRKFIHANIPPYN